MEVAGISLFWVECKLGWVDAGLGLKGAYIDPCLGFSMLSGVSKDSKSSLFYFSVVRVRRPPSNSCCWDPWYQKR